MSEEKIKRFDQPTLEDLKDLPCDDETRLKIKNVLCGVVAPADASPAARTWSNACFHRPKQRGHEMVLAAVDELLETCGVEGLEIEGDGHHTDEGIRMCPAFSYCNAGDPYIATLLRDHEAEMWLVAGWGDAADEYERENRLGSYLPCADCGALGEHSERECREYQGKSNVDEESDDVISEEP